MKGDKAHYFRSNADKARDARSEETATDTTTIEGGQVRDRTVVVAGASSAAGRATAAALVAAGARVVVVGSNAERLADVAAHARYVCDLADADAVTELAELIRSEVGPPDGLVHLVGGWRAGHDAEGWAWLEERLITTLRNTTVAFRDDLMASPAGRLAIVSSTMVDLPTWSNANYAAAKAAAEAWVKAMATSFTHAKRTASVPGGTGGTVIPFDPGVVTAAAVTFVVHAIGTGEGKVPVAMLANAIAGMWDLPSDELNGARVSFTV
ncbi:MAG: SDR family NAD(P)-dependent oxidoreductase [Glaciihabitans sp.]